MAISYYKGHDSYVIYGEESAYGTPATPSGSNFVGLVQNISLNLANNSIRTQGIGDGRNATSAVLGGFDVSGSFDFQVNDLTFMQYAIGTRAGGGIVSDPYELQELENIGYGGATEIPTLTFEIGSEGGSNDYTHTIDGCVLNSLTLTATQGEILTASVDWTGRSVSTGTSLTTYSPAAAKPFVFQEGSVKVGSDTVHACTAFDITIANDIQTFRSLGSRFLQQPVTGTRRYDFNMTIRMNYNDAASTLSSIELEEMFFGAAGDTSPETGGSATAQTLTFNITEGASTGDRVVDILLENVYFESIGQPIPLEGGVIEVSVAGYGLSGETDSSDKVFARYYTIA